jgi:hypothetical protein
VQNIPHCTLIAYDLSTGARVGSVVTEQCNVPLIVVEDEVLLHRILVGESSALEAMQLPF